MVKVYFQDKKGISSELIAILNNENIYNKCINALKEKAQELNMVLTESIIDDEIEKNEKILNTIANIISYDDRCEDKKIKEIYELLFSN